MITRSFMSLSNHNSNGNWLHTLLLGFQFGSRAAPQGAITVSKSGHQFTDPDENTQVSLVKLESLCECWLLAQQRLEIY